MKPRKEHYRRKMPHYQQPGQWYSVTLILKGAMPKGAMSKYAEKLEAARNNYQLLQREAKAKDVDFPTPITENPNSGMTANKISDLGKAVKQISDLGKSELRLAQAKKDYLIALRKYRLAYDKILNKLDMPGITLIKDKNRKIIEEALLFWEGKRLTNHAWCIMPNHVHWILTVFENEVSAGVSGVGVSNSDISNFGKLKSLSSTWESRSPESRSPESRSPENRSPESRNLRELDFLKCDNSNLQVGNWQSPEVNFLKSAQNKPVYLQDILHSVKLFTARRINENESRSGQLWEHESFETTIRNDRHFVNVMNYVIQNPVSAGMIENWKDWPGSRSF